jgi:solute carrier family 25 protein 33/36
MGVFEIELGKLTFQTRLQSDMFRHTATSLRTKDGMTAAANAATPRTGVTGALWHFWDTVVLIRSAKFCFGPPQGAYSRCADQRRRIGVEEGWRALYKGLGPSLVGIIPAR